MKLTTTPSARSTVVLEVEVPADRLQRSIEQSVRQLGRRTRVPGFRPGKVPRPMLERALGVRRDDPNGTNPIYTEAKAQLFEQTVADAVRQSELDVIEIPSPEWVRFAEGDGAAYRVTVPVVPHIALGDYTNYPFGIDLSPIGDEQVDKVVEELRDQHAALVPVEDRGAEKGDYAVIGFEATRDGQPFEGGSAERMPLIVGQERMIPGFEAQLLGLREGEERRFELTFPDDYPDAALAGQIASFHVTLRELRAKVLPPADDELASQLGAYASLDALRAELRERLIANARDRARHAFADRIIEYAAANATLEVPDVLVDREVEVMHDELRLRLAEQGIGYAEYLKATGKDDSAIHADYRPQAEHRVKVLLVLSEIAEREGVAVDDDAVAAELARARVRYAANRKLLEYFESARGRAYIRSTLRRSQTVEMLVDRWLADHPEVGPLPHVEEARLGSSPLAAEVNPEPEGSPA